MTCLDGLDVIPSFLMVAEELNFKRSAERLNMDQSALMRRVQKLENVLGFQLFERTTRKVSLTAAGHGSPNITVIFWSDMCALGGGLMSRSPA